MVDFAFLLGILVGICLVGVVMFISFFESWDGFKEGLLDKWDEFVMPDGWDAREVWEARRGR